MINKTDIKIRTMQAIVGLLKYFNKEKEYKPSVRKSKYQISVLNEILSISEYPSKDEQDIISTLIKLNRKSITTWFQNKRNSFFNCNKKEKIDNKINKKIGISKIFAICYKNLDANSKNFINLYSESLLKIKNKL